MIGHQRQKRFFEKAISSGQLAHAYILAGAEGVGKKLFATQVAKGLLCENGALFAACSCPACLQVENRTHPDFYLFDSKDDLKISGIRQIPEIVGSTSYSGKWKVIILDNAHQLCLAGVDAAANALLKTLEEPGQDTVFFLVTHKLERVIATIISRCLTVHFDPLSDGELAAVCEKVHYKAEPALLPYAGGSMSNLRSMAEFDFRTLSDAISRKDPEAICVKLLSINDKLVLQAAVSMLQVDFIRLFKTTASGDLAVFIQYLDRMKRELDYNVNLTVVLLDLYVKLTECLRIDRYGF